MKHLSWETKLLSSPNKSSCLQLISWFHDLREWESNQVDEETANSYAHHQGFRLMTGEGPWSHPLFISHSQPDGQSCNHILHASATGYCNDVSTETELTHLTFRPIYLHRQKVQVTGTAGGHLQYGNPIKHRACSHSSTTQSCMYMETLQYLTAVSSVEPTAKGKISQ